MTPLEHNIWLPNAVMRTTQDCTNGGAYRFYRSVRESSDFCFKRRLIFEWIRQNSKRSWRIKVIAQPTLKFFDDAMAKELERARRDHGRTAEALPRAIERNLAERREAQATLRERLRGLGRPMIQRSRARLGALAGPP